MTDRIGQLWTREEKEQLVREMNAQMPLEAICAEHGRTVYGIISMLQHLGIITAVGENYHRVSPEPWALGTDVRRLHRKPQEPK